jgi:two-component system, NarL family, sensor kinase
MNQPATARRVVVTVIACTLVFVLVGVYVLLRRPNDRAARTLFQSAWSLLVAVPWVFGLQVSDFFGGPSFWLYQAIVLGGYILFWISLLHFTLVFPAQHPLTVGRPWIIPLIYVVPFACYLVYLVATRYIAPSILSWIGLWEPGESALGLLYVTLAVVAMSLNYRASRDTATRQKIRWVVFATVVSGGGAVVLWIFPADV